MLKMVLMALAATALYGSQSVILRTWLGQYSTPVLLVCFYAVGMAISVALLGLDVVRGKSAVFPTGPMMYAAVAAGAAYCIADYFMIGSLRLATSVAVTSVLLLTPVFAGVGTYIVGSLGQGHETSLLPNRYEVLTFVMIVLTLVVFQKSQEVRATQQSVVMGEAH